MALLEARFFEPADANTDEPHLFAERDSPQTIEGGLPDKVAGMGRLVQGLLAGMGFEITETHF